MLCREADPEFLDGSDRRSYAVTRGPRAARFNRRGSVLHVAEDRRIALAALAVAAVVPIVTLLTTTRHDSNRLHAEQVQGDRAELREVLDEAATALNLIAVDFNKLLQLGPKSQGLRDKVLAGIARGARSYTRVAIRLGPGASATREMKKAVDAASAVNRGLVQGRDVSRDIEAYVRQSGRFVEAAYRAARSTIE